MLKVTVEEQAIRFGDRCAVSFHRTLRIPDDGRTYPLPPGLGRFPLFRVEDYPNRVPAVWREQGGVFIAMYQCEALWLGFHGASWKPNAMMVAVGRINVLSGTSFGERLCAKPQNYFVCPDQPWLDGINAGHGSIRQFVAMPLGLGYTVEASLTGVEKFGGIQVTVFEPKPGRFPDHPPEVQRVGSGRMAVVRPSVKGELSMGLGAGGVMKQKIYPDPYGIDTWDPDNSGRMAVHIVNSIQFHELTGIEPPPTPIEAKTYTEHGLPWFELYDENRGDIEPSKQLQEVISITEKDVQLGEIVPRQGAIDVPETQINKLRKKQSGRPKPTPIKEPGHSFEDE